MLLALMMLSLLCVLVALIRPRMVWPFRSAPHRGKAMLLYVGLAFIFALAYGKANPLPPGTVASSSAAPVAKQPPAAPSPTKEEQQAAAAREAIPVFEAATMALMRDSDLKMQRMQQYFDLLVAGKATAGDVYGAAMEASTAAMQLSLKIDRELEIPDDLSEALEALLGQARNSITGVALARQRGTECLADYIEHQKPSDQHCFSQASKDVQAASMRYAISMAEARQSVGLLENASANITP